MHPDADYGSQFSEGGLVQDTIQQASNRFERPAITSDLELGNAIWVNSGTSRVFRCNLREFDRLSAHCAGELLDQAVMP